MNEFKLTSPRSSNQDNVKKISPYRIQYSNTPISVSVKDASSVKGTETTLENFGDQLVKDIIETDPACDLYRARYQELKKINDQSVIANLKDCHKISLAMSPRKKKGSMYISELWSGKHLHNVVKTSGIGQKGKTISRNSPGEPKEKLDNPFDKQVMLPKLLDPEKVIEQFLARDPFKPQIKNQDLFPLHTDRGKSLPRLSVDAKELEDIKNECMIRKSITRKRPDDIDKITAINELMIKIQSPEKPNKPKISLKSCSDVVENRRKTCIFPSEHKKKKSSILLSPRSIEGSSALIDQSSNKLNISSLKEINGVSGKNVAGKIVPPINLGEIDHNSDLGGMSYSTLDSKNQNTTHYRYPNKSLTQVEKCENSNLETAKNGFLKAKAASSRVLIKHKN